MAAEDLVWEVRVDYEDNHSETVVVHAPSKIKALANAPRIRTAKLKTGFIYIQPCGVRIIRQRINDSAASSGR